MRQGETRKQFEERAKKNNLTPREQDVLDRAHSNTAHYVQAGMKSGLEPVIDEIVANEKKAEAIGNRVLDAEAQIETLSDRVDNVDVTAKAVAYKQTNQLLEESRTQIATVAERVEDVYADVTQAADQINENAGALVKRIEAHSGSDHLKLKAIITRLTTR